MGCTQMCGIICLAVCTLVSRTRFKPIMASVCSQRALDLALLTSGGRLRRAAKRSVSHTDSVCTKHR